MQIAEGLFVSRTGVHRDGDGSFGGPSAVVRLLDHGVVGAGPETEIGIQACTIHYVGEDTGCRVDAHRSYSFGASGIGRSDIVNWRADCTHVCRRSDVDAG